MKQSQSENKRDVWINTVKSRWERKESNKNAQWKENKNEKESSKFSSNHNAPYLLLYLLKIEISKSSYKRRKTQLSQVYLEHS